MSQINEEQQVESMTQVAAEESDTQGYMKPVYDDGSGDKGRPGAGNGGDPISGGLIPYRTNGPTVSNGYLYPNGTVHPYP
jgi:hypothetical protein